MTRKEGVVLKGTGGVWHVRADSGETHEASLRGRLKQEREETKKLAVGDRVVLEIDERGVHWAIAEILPRHSKLARREPGSGQGERIVAANVDLGQGARSFSEPSSVSFETQISGVGSTVVGSGEAGNSRTGYSLAGNDARETSSPVSSAIDTAPRYAGESNALLSPSSVAAAVQSSPGIADNNSCILRPRRSNALRISATAERSPDTAASAARWATLQTLDVECDCRLVAAVMTSRGAIIQPTLQPVMA